MYSVTIPDKNYRLPSDATLKHAAKLSMVERYSYTKDFIIFNTFHNSTSCFYTGFVNLIKFLLVY